MCLVIGEALEGATGKVMLVDLFNKPILDFSVRTKYGVWNVKDLDIVDEGDGIYSVELLPSQNLPKAKYQILIFSPTRLKYSNKFDVPDGLDDLELADLVGVDFKPTSSGGSTGGGDTGGVVDEARVVELINFHKNKEDAHRPQITSILSLIHI